MFKTIAVFWLGLLVSNCLISVSAAELNLDRLDGDQIRQVKYVLERLGPVIKAKQTDWSIATLNIDELYSILGKAEREFLEQFETLDPTVLNIKIPFHGFSTGKEKLLVIRDQKYKFNGKEKEIPPQFLPEEVLDRYHDMMNAMNKDLGKRLLIESGYRSSAYQLYLFLFYLRNHNYSIKETVKHVALPGYSEHGATQHQAVDFINEEGINGENDPYELVALPEYQWLLNYAGQFGFMLSYPEDNPNSITFEPWHWRYERGLWLASQKAKKLGYDLDQMKIVWVEGELRWLNYDPNMSEGVRKKIKALEGKDFQAVYFGPKNKNQGLKKLWIFLNKKDNKIITFLQSKADGGDSS